MRERETVIVVLAVGVVGRVIAHAIVSGGGSHSVGRSSGDRDGGAGRLGFFDDRGRGGCSLNRDVGRVHGVGARQCSHCGDRFG